MTHRPRTLAAASAAAIALLVTGCSAGAQAETAPTGASAETRSLDDTFLGAVDGIPAEPERVVALWRSGSILADLGVVPVGQLDGELAEEELTDEQWAAVADVPSVGTYDDIDIEAIIAAEPDLIVGMDHGRLGIDYAELQEIAPVLILEIAEPTDVWANYPVLADALGRTEGYEEALAELNARVEAIAAEHGDALAELQATDLTAIGEEIWVSTSKSLVYERIAGVGFGYDPTYTADPERYATLLAREDIPSLDDSDVIFYAAEYDGSVWPDVEALLAEPAFRALPAVQAGRLFPLRGATIYTFEGQHAMLDDLEAAIAELEAQA